MIHFHAFPDAASAAAAQATALAERLRERLAARAAPVVLALSGGRSPIPFFHALREQPLAWSRVELRLVDERLVAPDQAFSNERFLREHLLQAQAAAACCIGLVPMDWPLTPTPEQVAALLQRANAPQAPLDIAVLGLGTDGHIASLFATAPEYASATDLTATTRYALLHPDLRKVDPAVPRVSLTLTALLAAQHWQLGLSGDVKRAQFEQARDAGANPELPLSLLLANLPTEAEFDVYWHPGI